MRDMTVAQSPSSRPIDSGEVESSAVLTATVVTSRHELEAYAAEWNNLLSASRANTIFLTWEWISTWLDTVYPGGSLLTVAVRSHSGHLVAIAPLYCSDLRLLGLLRYNTLRVIGDCQCGGEYPDVIIRAGFEDTAMPLVMRTLLKHSGAWDVMWVCNVAGRTDALPRFDDVCKRLGWYIHERPRDFASLTLPPMYEAYLAGLSKNSRTQIKRDDKKLRNEHMLELVRCEREDTLFEFLSELFTLHRKRWETVGQAGSFVRRPPMKRFYEAFAPVALRQGWLRLYGLRVDGVIRAVQYGYAYEGVFSQLQEGYDPNGFDGIGNVLRNEVMKASIAEGLREYDFLGGFSEHKRRWGAGLISGHDLFIGRPTLKNIPLFIGRIWPTGRFIKEGRPASDGCSHD